MTSTRTRSVTVDCGGFWTYLLLTFPFLQQFTNFLFFGLQVVAQVVVLSLRLVDQLVQIGRLLLDLPRLLLQNTNQTTREDFLLRDRPGVRDDVDRPPEPRCRMTADRSG